jgi:hypothetical protein
MLHDIDTQRLEVVCIAHPREHQQLWRVDGPTAENDLLGRPDLMKLTLLRG